MFLNFENILNFMKNICTTGPRLDTMEEVAGRLVRPPLGVREPDGHRLGVRGVSVGAAVQVLRGGVRPPGHPGEDVRALPRPD